jgi:RNA polymerase sigma factor (sigma-70 family)
MNDWQLLNEYAARGSEDAFRELVDRYAGMVYHSALRQVRDPQMAQEVAQTVFIALAQKAHRIPKQTVLFGWLFRATRYAAWHRVREESCRRRYEEEAATMESMLDPQEAETIWDQISPYLNDALGRLSRIDREALMIRYFGDKSHKEVAQALGLSEDSAKKRISRALEKLRMIFARRGVVVPSIALAAAFSTCGAQAAPAGLTLSITAAALAKGSGTTSLLATAKAVLKLMAWAQAKTVLAVGTGVLLVAAGTATVAVNAVGTRPEDLVAKLQHPSGTRIAWDRHLELSASLDLKRVPLEQALDDLSVHSGAYWTIDYAVYGSEQALRRLLDSLHEGTELEGAGWTNLSARPLKSSIMVEPDGQNLGSGYGGGFDTGGGKLYLPNAGVERRFAGGAGTGRGKPVVSDRVSMVVVVRGDAAVRWRKNVQDNMARKRQGDPDVRVFDTEESAIIRQAMNQGVAEGVLAPERLLAETGLTSKLDLATPAPATAETAERVAKAAHAHWTTIYTLRKSPVEGAGIKLRHAGIENLYVRPQANMTFDDFIKSSLTNRFSLSPEDRAAHDRAVQAFKNKN